MPTTTCRCGKPLPLTRPLNRDVLEFIDEASIRAALVDAFYERVRADETLGPIFARLITDWQSHMPKMYDFWTSAVLRTGRYSGRPIEAHQGLPGVELAHYRRWIDLWELTVRERINPDAASLLVDLAVRMGKVMTDQFGPARG